ncbi:MAG TPA: tRNA (adenosine(37)-N6)-threonylcarbamoyltransferase complex ATPase subunit type 1 TsaE [Candidatus Dormibacteraeota bacterium]|nr:tRNA (adenosine(37)-N6)-threonylcarbamoyltransferase complex ATPase subunit type 1 TsaE [Candidatus Dormibacteraeota bacterium]
MVTTTSAAETELAGRRFGERLQRGDIVLLSGELGAGKTTFVRGVAQGIGSKASVASPTFQLVRLYPGPVQLAHVDLYRVENSIELADLGLEELAEQGAVVVEWGERLEVPEAAHIEIQHLGGDRRLIRIERDLRH